MKSWIEKWFSYKKLLPLNHFSFFNFKFPWQNNIPSQFSFFASSENFFTPTDLGWNIVSARIWNFQQTKINKNIWKLRYTTAKLHDTWISFNLSKCVTSLFLCFGVLCSFSPFSKFPLLDHSIIFDKSVPVKGKFDKNSENDDFFKFNYFSPSSIKLYYRKEF